MSWSQNLSSMVVESILEEKTKIQTTGKILCTVMLIIFFIKAKCWGKAKYVREKGHCAGIKISLKRIYNIGKLLLW